MADRARKQLCTLKFNRLHIAVKCPYLHVIRARYLTCFSRHTKATLIPGLLPRRLHDLGIDQHNRLIRFHRHINHNKLF